MKKSVQVTVIALSILFFGFSLLCWIRPSEAYSVSERRKLAQFPKFSYETVAEGKFMADFEKYALDQFPFRDGFRKMKAWVSRNIFRKTDDNKIYVTEGYAVKMEYPLREDSLTYALEKFQNLYDTLLKDSAGKIYAAVIPDKNYFLAESSGHLSMDYEKFFSAVREGMPYAAWIDLRNTLSAEDYYRTDVHWRQERLVDTASVLAEGMGIPLKESYEQKTLENEFYGVCFGQSALNLPGEELHYLTNDMLEQCVVYNYENNQTSKVYDLSKAQGKDPYEIYLSGPVSLLTLENPQADTDRELVVFRDSFGSSLIPLLAEGYAKITLVDIRYIQSAVLKNYVDFQGKDVLFLYSTVVLNNSETLK